MNTSTPIPVLLASQGFALVGPFLTTQPPKRAGVYLTRSGANVARPGAPVPLYHLRRFARGGWYYGAQLDAIDTLAGDKLNPLAGKLRFAARGSITLRRSHFIALEEWWGVSPACVAKSPLE